MSDRSIIYTAIAGGYDNLKPPMDDGGRERSSRIAFLDSPAICAGIDCPGWQIQQMPSMCMDPLMQSKRYKVLSHEVLPAGTEFSLWVDGSIEVSSRMSVDRLASQYLQKADLALFPHPNRDCLYDEAHKCHLKKLDDGRVMARQMNRYRAEGYPRNNGLAECGVILRRHTLAVARLNEMWWKEIDSGSRRDQLSFNYVCWKLGVEYSLLPGTRNTYPLLRVHRHAKPRVPRQ